jgi:hypothetical protein
MCVAGLWSRPLDKDLNWPNHICEGTGGDLGVRVAQIELCSSKLRLSAMQSGLSLGAPRD